MRAHLYLRCSTGRQADSGLGMEAQEMSCRAWADARGIPVASVHTDAGLSGSLPVDKRPALLDALASLSDGDVLVVAKRDRLARDVLAAAMAERLADQAGASIVSAAGEGSDVDGPSGQLVRTILDAVAAHERALIAMRVRAAFRVKRSRGEHLGGRAPFGYSVVDGRLEANEDERRATRRALALRDEGLSLRAIGSTLTQEGFKPRGRSWGPKAVSRALSARLED